MDIGTRISAIAAALTVGAAVFLLATDFIDVQRARRVIEPTLLDPASAQFRGVNLYDGRFLCGEVNAKNRVGGYVGFRKFLVTFDPDQVEMEEEVSEIPALSVQGETERLLQHAENSRFLRDWITLCK